MKSMPSRFETACDPDFLRPGLEYAIERATGERADIVDLEVPRAFPRKDGGLTLELRARFRGEGSSETRSLRLGGHLLSPAERWPGYVTAHTSKVLCFEALRFVVPLFPFDPKLRLLPQLLDTDRALGLLRRAGVPGLEDASGLVPEVLGYRLERRCVLRHLPVTSSKRAVAPALVTKALRPGRTASLQGAFRALATAGATGLAPNTRTLDAGRGLHVMEEVPGTPLHDLDASREYASGCEAAGHALARLHTLPREDLPQRSVEEALRALERLVDLASEILPSRSTELRATHRAVLAKRPADLEARARTAVHGDFYDKQVLRSSGHAVVLDWDGLACGDPAQDHGNFTAHIALRAAQAPEHAVQIELGAAAFTRGYRSSGSEYLARARWWEAAALVRLAALYGLRRRWRHLVPVLLERAIRSLEQQSRVATLLTLLVATLSLQILAPVAALLGATTTAAQTLDGIQLRASQHRSDIVLVTTGSPEPRLFELGSPARVVLDLVGASKSLEVTSQDLAEGPVERVRIGQFVDSPAPITRIVADLRRSCRYELAQVEGGFALALSDSHAVAAAQLEESLPVHPRSPATPPPVDEAEGPESLVDDVAERQAPAQQAPVASWAPGGAVLEVDERAEFTASANGALRKMAWAVRWEPSRVLGGLTTYEDGARTVVTIHARQSGVGRLWVTGDGRELAEAKLYVLPPPPSKSFPVALTTLAVGALAGALAARENDESDLRIWLGYGALPMLALGSGIAWWRYRDREAARREFLARPPENQRETPLVSATKSRTGG